MSRVIWYIIVIALTLVVLLLIWQFSISIVLFGLSLAVAAALRPLINEIAMRIRSKRLALSLVYASVIGLILILLGVGGQFLFQDLQKATDDFATSYERIKKEWPLHGSLFQQSLAEQLPSPDDLYRAITSEEGLLTLTTGGVPGQDIFSVIGYIAIILVLSMYWSADQLRFERLAVYLFPTEHRPKALHIWRSIESGVGAYMRSEFVLSVLAGLILGVGYWLIGLRYPAMLATWSGIVRLIPWFGVLVATLPLFLVAGGSPVTGFLAILFTLIVLLFLRFAVGPRFVAYQQNNSLLIVLFVILLAEAFGFIGLLLAPPLAVAVQILLRELYPLLTRRNMQQLQDAFELRNRLSRLRKRSKGQESDDLKRFVNQLFQLVRQTVSYMQRY
jgi:predicted PurR-regulated permease PerM